jgi:PAS domain-containing protein
MARVAHDSGAGVGDHDFEKEAANERPDMELSLNYRYEKQDESTGLPPTVEGLIGARTTDAVFVVDPKYRIVHWDARAESLTGFLAEEVIGRPYYEVVSGQGARTSGPVATVFRARPGARTRRPLPAVAAEAPRL